MSMTKKNYVQLAKILKDNAMDYDGLVIDLVAYLKADNPNFNADKFRSAIL